MKKMLMVMISILCLCGCGSSLGSFEDGTLDHTELIRRLNSASVENGWQLMMLKENADTGGLQRYGLRTEDVVSYGIYPAVLQAVPDEIAFFEITEDNRTHVIEKVHTYVESRQQDTVLLPSYKEVLKSYKELEIGKYYIIIIGKDAQKAAQFIEECR
ncbi:MAG: DUF4358 domain-containing protein [Erysipelotrichaceae bacterium]|nr:DUF4358 domain-containing protein [Erysipelotrichaceae bacterium]